MSQNLKPGQAIDIKEDELHEAVKGELTGLDRMESIRENDVKEFIDKISLNWQITITRNRFHRTYTISK